MRISDWSSDVCSSDLYRAELLRRLHLDFIGEASEIDETPQPGEDVASLVRRLALAKARALRDRHPDGWILGSDQAAALDKQILGKPGNLEQAHAKLRPCAETELRILTSVVLALVEQVQDTLAVPIVALPKPRPL